MGMYRFFITVLITVTYAYGTFGSSVIDSGFAQYTLCTTNKCIRAASEILANLNRTVDPCDNFYKFACGGRHNRGNVSEPDADTPYLIAANTQKLIREILEKPSKPGDTVSLLQAKHVYAQCMNNKNGQTGKKNNLSKIINKYVEWPLLLSRSEWEKKNLTWQTVSTILHKNGFDNGLYNLQVSSDKETSTNNVIFISRPSFYFSQFDGLFTLRKQVEQIYVTDIIHVASNFIKEIGGTVKIKKIIQDALDIMHFETKLHALKYKPERLFGRTIKEFQELCYNFYGIKKKEIDWHSSIQEAFASEGIAIEPSEKVVFQHTYLFELLQLLQQTPSRTIVNYMIWAFIRKFYDHIKTYPSLEVSYDTAHATNSTQYEEEYTTWNRCVENSYFPFAISHEFVKTYVLYKNIPRIKGISIHIEIEFREQIRKAAWMDVPTKIALLKKLKDIRYGFMSLEWYNNEAVDKYYEGLNVNMEYTESLINIFKFERKKMLSSLRTPVDTFRWRLLPTMECYFLQAEYFVITAVLLQNHAYNKSRLPLINYSWLGFIIAHEINRGLDYTGGAYKNSKTKTRSRTRSARFDPQCFIDQYNNYFVPEVDANIIVDGGLAEENIAHFVGIETTYHAYKNRKAWLNEPERRLHGLEEYSEDQIFFMSYAQLLCDDLVPQEIWKGLRTAHLLKEIRISSSLSNLYEFSDAYNCPVGKLMNPENKCVFWQYNEEEQNDV